MSIIGDIARTDSIYETLLEQMVEESEKNIRKEKVKLVITAMPLSIAIGREIKEVLWPSCARVVKIFRGEESVYPEADTVILEGDVLTFSCYTDNPKIVEDDLRNILGNLI